MTYTYEGIELVESGEERVPRRNEYFITYDGRACIETDRDGNITSRFHNEGRRKILIPKGENMDEYNIPVLVKVDADKIPNAAFRFNSDAGMAKHLGKVVMCRRQNETERMQGPKDEWSGGWAWADQWIIVGPSKKQVEEEAAKLKALTEKPDPVPQVVRNFLTQDHAGICQDAKRFSQAFAKLIYENPPKAP